MISIVPRVIMIFFMLFKSKIRIHRKLVGISELLYGHTEVTKS